jgi:hypothetical protein
MFQLALDDQAEASEILEGKKPIVVPEYIFFSGRKHSH